MLRLWCQKSTYDLKRIKNLSKLGNVYFAKLKVEPIPSGICGVYGVYFRSYSNVVKSIENFSKLSTGPSLKDFITQDSEIPLDHDPNYFEFENTEKIPRKVFIETYGCQMNFSDTEVAMSILLENGFLKTNSVNDADVILVMTCSIRESAEDKIWKRMRHYEVVKSHRNSSRPPLKIGILGCMAERLKTKILEQEKLVDLVCGPDAYRDLPRLLAITESNQSAANVQLSLEETYSDITPVRINPSSKSAFVSIMRGCDNMCTYCIVPFTRGRERSRPISSIRSEISNLSDQGVKEVVLLGQNVNSYRDTSELNFVGQQTNLSDGFKTVYKSKQGGLRFADLLDKVSLDYPEMRFRFTSPHPKDFPDEVLYMIKERANIGTNLHLPAQSGNNVMLENMRRGYTRETYLQLVDHIRSIIPDVALTSDFISGFCGETEEAHQDTLSLLKLVKYEFCFCFMYSMREKTRAFHRLVDDVPLDVKKRRRNEVNDTFRELALERHRNQIGQEQLVLVEGESRRSENDLCGRNEGNTKVIFPKVDIKDNGTVEAIQPGDYVIVKINDCSSQVLKGNAISHSSITDFANYQANEMLVR